MENTQNIEQDLLNEELKSQSMIGVKEKLSPTIVVSISIFAIILTLILVKWSYIKLILQKPFALNEDGYSYQIEKCWDANLPSFWLKRTQTDNDGYIKIGDCSFQANAVMPLIDEENFNGILNRNLEVQGELIKKGLLSYYKISSATPMATVNSNQANLPKEKFIIKRKTESGEEIIYQRPKLDEHRIVIWENYLFFEPEQKDNSKERLIKHNLKTGKTEVVYEEDNNRRFLLELKLIDNKLFFSIGGYLAGSDIFYLATPNSVAKNLKTGQASFGFSRVEYDGKNYWLKGGEGDACWGIQNIALFNPKTNAIGKTIVSNFGCSDGDELIGYDNKGRMIMASHTMDEKTSEVTYHDISAISPTFQGNKKELLLDKSDMPNNVGHVAISTASGQLALVGESLSLFNLDSNELEKIVDMPGTSSIQIVYKWQDNNLCIFLDTNDTAGSNRYLVDLANKSYAKNDPACDEKQESNPTYEETRNKALDQLISDLKLPENYITEFK